MFPGVTESVLALSSVQRAVRDVFTQGGSTVGVLLTLLGLLGIVFLAYVLSEALHRARGRRRQPNCPKKLFHDLLDELDLTGRQRAFLLAVAKQRSMQHPATLLLSPEVFDLAVAATSRTPAGRSGMWAQTAADVRKTLFPDGVATLPDADGSARDYPIRSTANPRS